MQRQKIRQAKASCIAEKMLSEPPQAEAACIEEEERGEGHVASWHCSTAACTLGWGHAGECRLDLQSNMQGLPRARRAGRSAPTQSPVGTPAGPCLKPTPILRPPSPAPHSMPSPAPHSMPVAPASMHRSSSDQSPKGAKASTESTAPKVVATPTGIAGLTVEGISRLSGNAMRAAIRAHGAVPASKKVHMEPQLRRLIGGIPDPLCAPRGKQPNVVEAQRALSKEKPPPGGSQETPLDPNRGQSVPAANARARAAPAAPEKMQGVTSAAPTEMASPPAPTAMAAPPQEALKEIDAAALAAPEKLQEVTNSALAAMPPPGRKAPKEARDIGSLTLEGIAQLSANAIRVTLRAHGVTPAARRVGMTQQLRKLVMNTPEQQRLQMLIEGRLILGKTSDGSLYEVEEGDEATVPWRDTCDACHMQPEPDRPWYKCAICVGIDLCEVCVCTGHAHPHKLFCVPCEKAPSEFSRIELDAQGGWNARRDVQLLDAVWSYRQHWAMIAESLGISEERAKMRLGQMLLHWRKKEGLGDPVASLRKALQLVPSIEPDYAGQTNTAGRPRSASAAERSVQQRPPSLTQTRLPDALPDAGALEVTLPF